VNLSRAWRFRETFDNGGFSLRSSVWSDHLHVEDAFSRKVGTGSRLKNGPNQNNESGEAPMLFLYRIAAVLAVLAPLFVLPVNAQAPERRFALVIGNSEYKAGRLPTAANDAGLIAETLRTAGFDVAGARDLDQDTLRRSIRDGEPAVCQSATGKQSGREKRSKASGTIVTLMKFHLLPPPFVEFFSDCCSSRHTK